MNPKKNLTILKHIENYVLARIMLLNKKDANFME